MLTIFMVLLAGAVVTIALVALIVLIWGGE